jgi:hypothetical protein
VTLLLEPFSDAKLVLGGAEEAGNLSRWESSGSAPCFSKFASSSLVGFSMAGWGFGVEGQAAWHTTGGVVVQN